MSRIAVLLTVASICVAAVRAEPQSRSADVANGKALITSSKCLDCHRIGETGSRLGPDLSEVGDRLSAEQLRRAILSPDEEVTPDNRFVRIVTKDGATVIVGKLINQDAFSIQLMNQAEQLKSYQRSDLREIEIQEKGLMPAYDKLTAQQVADLVGYLQSLKGAQK